MSEMCGLREVIGAAWAAVAAAAEARNIELEMGVPDHLECPMERARIERVFSNLFENAIDAMRSGGKVMIGSETDHDNILVRVDDTGPGISPLVRSRLFQPFVTAGKKNGLGLGLALSRQALLDHGGDIWVEGDGPGARFCLRLPKERSTMPNDASKLNGDGVVAGD